MFDFKTYIAEQGARVNAALEIALKQCGISGQIVDAMRYSLLAGGKRIRPILCLAAAAAVGGKPGDAMPAACALEMIHTYSLIHDDLPAMDNDDLRRGKPTCHIAFDEATAVLAGDALLTLAFQHLSSATADHPDQPDLWLSVIRTISQAAGCPGMIQGQMLDIDSENTMLTLDELEAMHTLKTGALIAASLKSGAILGRGSPSEIQQLAEFARNLGLAFQVTDDILNVEGDPAIMGKAIGTDQLRHKSTYPSIMGLEESKHFASNLVTCAINTLEIFDTRADPLRATAKYILNRNR